MRITFIYTDLPDLKQVPGYDRYSNWIDVPDVLLERPDAQEMVMTLTRSIGTVTQASLHVHCPPLAMKHVFVKQGDYEPGSPTTYTRFAPCTAKLSVMAERSNPRMLTVYNPIPPQIDARYSSRHPYMNPLTVSFYKTPEEQAFVQLYRVLADTLETVMNTDPFDRWRCTQFIPWYSDDAWSKKKGNQKKQREKKLKEQARAAKKKEKEAAKTKMTGTPHPQTGAGRGSGPIPGIFMGVQMRSQLEIRFAAEMQERGIEWIYEQERLGDGNYLVDFHLPQKHCWVEVKGKVEARDKFLLADVAAILQGERSEKLYMFTSRRVYRISETGIGIGMKHTEFWALLA